MTVSVAEGETVALRTADDGADGAVDCTVRLSAVEADALDIAHIDADCGGDETLRSAQRRC